MECFYRKINRMQSSPFPFSVKLRDIVELKYDIMEKQAYALIKYLKYFRVYIVHSYVIAYVPNNVVKNILTQLDLEGKRAK